MKEGIHHIQVVTGQDVNDLISFSENIQKNLNPIVLLAKDIKLKEENLKGEKQTTNPHRGRRKG
jgi:hypothetical protein